MSAGEEEEDEDEDEDEERGVATFEGRRPGLQAWFYSLLKSSHWGVKGSVSANF